MCKIVGRRVARPALGIEENGDSADGGQTAEPARLRRVDSGEWRYGQADQPSRRAEEPPPHGASDPSLWTEDPSNAWGSTLPWVPPQRPAPPADEPDTGSWQSTSEWSQPRHATVPAPALPQLPAVSGAVPAGLAMPGGPVGPAYVGTHASAGNGSSPAEPGQHARTGLDSWSRPDPGPRRRITEEDEFGPHRSARNPYGEEPAYGPVLGYTAGWYGLPALFYLVWLVTLDDERQSLAGRQFVASLPWLFAAIVLSLAVAGLLRWAIVGWRAVTLSFAAAVIGAGVVTIAHSLTL